MHRVLLSTTFEKQFRDLPTEDQRRNRRKLAALEQDPLAPRAGADIKRLAGTQPPKHRLRVGDYRIIYAVERAEVRVIEVFRRARRYRE